MPKQENPAFTTIDFDKSIEPDNITDIKKPKLYNVVLLNDDFTRMDFVIQLLINIFGKSYQQAYDITMQVHHFESGVAGTYHHEVAIEKSQQANNLAAMNEFPLMCKVEQQ